MHSVAIQLYSHAVHMATLERLFLSKARGAVLRCLFGLRDEERHVRAIERESDLTVNAVREELDKLRALDLIVARRDGNRLYYSANRSHPLYPELRAIVIKTDGLRDVLVEALNSPDIKVAFVYGSLARGEERATSDLDLLVIGSLGLRELTRLLMGTAEKIGREVNPVVFRPDEFRERVAGQDAFVKDVLAKPKLFVIGGPGELESMA